jgi:hypothetical protein
MYWLAAGLFFIGAVCGATIRLMVFVVVVLGAAIIAIAVGFSHGAGAAILDAVLAVVALQVGYVAGLLLRAAVRSRQIANPPQADHSRPTAAPAGEKRR